MEKNASLFGAVGKSSVKVKGLRRQQQLQQQQQQLNPKRAATACRPHPTMMTSTDHHPPTKMSNKKKKKKTALLITKNSGKPAVKLSKRKKQREAMQQQQHNRKNQQQPRSRIKIFQLPKSSESRKLCQSPWFCHSHHVPLPTPPVAASSSSSSSSQQQQQRRRLPYPFLVESTANDHNVACWDWLDYELHLFANYVRLQQVEIQARDDAIHQIRNLAMDLFRHNKNNNNNNSHHNNNNTARRMARQQQSSPTEEKDKADKEDDSLIRVEAFGSYAAPSVCCFQSDIDLAIWGVVATPPQRQASAPTRFQAAAAAAVAAATDNDVAVDPAVVARLEKRKRHEERIQRWKEALTALNDAKHKQQQSQEDDKAKRGHEEAGNVPREPKEDNVVVETKQVKRKPSPSKDKPSRQKAEEETDALVEDSQQEDALVEDPEQDQPSAMEPPTSKRRKMLASGNEKKDFLFVLDRTGVEELGGSPPPHQEEPPSDPLLDQTATANVSETNASCVAPADQATGIACDNANAAASELPNEPNAMRKDSIDLFAMGIPCMDDSVDNPHLEEMHMMEHMTEKEGAKVATKRKARYLSNMDYFDLTLEESKFETIDLTLDDDDDDESFPGREASDSDDDTADKMSAFNYQGDLQSESDDDLADKMSAFVRRADRDELISLSSSTTSKSDDEEFDESGLEVSFVSSTRSDTSRKSNDVGPKGQMKQQVVSALMRLGNALRKRPWTHRLEIRKHARVPIINMTTVTGFESDIALGGHTGMDTRLYATTLTSQYER